MTVNYILEHLLMVFVTVILSILIGIPLGVLAYFNPRLKNIIISTIDVFQTIPSLASLGIIMVFFGAGKATAIVGLTFYSLLPIVNNTYVALSNISPPIIEAAVGIGMNKRDRLLRVMLPMAIPMIFTGIKISTVTAVGSAVFAVFVGGGGLGSVIYRGIRIQNMSLILQGMSAIMLMALGFDKAMSIMENTLQRRYKATT